MLPNFATLGVCLTFLFTNALAHMEMSNPPPIKSRFNKNSRWDDIDYNMKAPLKADGSNFPCKGYHKLSSTTFGTPMAVLKGGESSSLTITDTITHGGGSCQISLSVDGGQTFRVLHTYIGNCPSAPGDNTLNFRVPVDVPSKERALLAWSWFNKFGNREMYMNCASVTTQSGGPGNSFHNLPTIFEANIGNGCKTVDSKDLMIPNPGNFTTLNNPNAVPAVGVCEVAVGAPGTGAFKPPLSSPEGWNPPPSPSPAPSPPLASSSPLSSPSSAPSPPAGDCQKGSGSSLESVIVANSSVFTTSSIFISAICGLSTMRMSMPII
ncbi:Fc.00g047250.m01.CDS01 [Cosmosporella sp. VM-42]